jgi:hypothetical protein
MTASSGWIIAPRGNSSQKPMSQPTGNLTNRLWMRSASSSPQIRDQPRGNTSASGAPTVEEESEDAAPAEPDPLDVNRLANAVTGHVGRSAEGQTPQGYDYFPASVWLNLDQSYLDQIESVNYYFYHRTFRNPMLPEADSNVFLANWKGYGCIENAEVKVTLKSGEELAAPFNLCTIWDRFHPGAFRKDGRRSGTAPLSSSEDFRKTTND